MKFLTTIAVAALLTVSKTQQAHVFGPQAVVTEDYSPNSDRILQIDLRNDIIRNLQNADDGIVPIEGPHDHPDIIRLLQVAEQEIFAVEIPDDHPDFIRLLQGNTVKPQEREKVPKIIIDEFQPTSTEKYTPQIFIDEFAPPQHHKREITRTRHQEKQEDIKGRGIPDEFQSDYFREDQEQGCDEGTHPPGFDYSKDDHKKQRHGKHSFWHGVLWVSIIAFIACCLMKCCSANPKCGKGKKRLEKLSVDQQIQHHRSELNKLQIKKNQQLQNANAINAFAQYQQLRPQQLPQERPQEQMPINPYRMPVEQSYEQERIAFGQRPPVRHNQRALPIPVGRQIPEHSYENGYPSL